MQGSVETAQFCYASTVDVEVYKYEISLNMLHAIWWWQDTFY